MSPYHTERPPFLRQPPVHITVLVAPPQLPSEVDGIKAQTSIYGDILDACLSEEAFEGVTFWGITDLHSW